MFASPWTSQESGAYRTPPLATRRPGFAATWLALLALEVPSAYNAPGSVRTFRAAYLARHCPWTRRHQPKPCDIDPFDGSGTRGRKRGSLWIAGRRPAPHRKTALSHSAWTRLRLAHTTHSHYQPSKEGTPTNVDARDDRPAWWVVSLSSTCPSALRLAIRLSAATQPCCVSFASKRLVVPPAVSRPDRFGRKTSIVLRAALCAHAPPAMNQSSMVVVAAPLAAPSRRNSVLRRTHLHQ